ncbi:Glutathione S-transferase, C-terminal-like protein, partial [Naviculisporaceae sp. PSN 640]
MSTPPPEKIPKQGVNIYGAAVVNPYKLSILAEELGIPYNYIEVDFAKGEHKSPWFTAINPNGRLPALVHVKEDGTSINVFESGACMMYLVSEFDTPSHKISYPLGTAEHWIGVSWLIWQTASYGPMMGQACHFNRYYPAALHKTRNVGNGTGPEEPTGGMEYGSWRFTSECRRLNSVLEDHLSSTPEQKFIVPGEKLTTADIAIFIYACSAAWCGVDINEYPHVQSWIGRLAERPAFQKGLTVPSPYMFSDAAVSSEEAVGFHKAVRKFGNQTIKAASEDWWNKTGGKAKIPVIPSDFANL